MENVSSKFTSIDIKKAQTDMIACPFCASNKVKLTTVSKGSNKGNKVQGMCNVCYGRGPAVADDPYKAVELWNKRWLYGVSEVDSIILNKEQMNRFIKGEILLHITSQIEFGSLLYYCEDLIENCKASEWKYLWNDYKENTVVDEDKAWFGYSEYGWYKKNDTRPIEKLIVVGKKSFRE